MITLHAILPSEPLKYYLQTERALLWLLPIWTMGWSGKKSKTIISVPVQFPSFHALERLKKQTAPNSCFTLFSKTITSPSSLKIDVSNYHFEYCLACYGSSMQQNVCIGCVLLISLRLLTGPKQSWQRRPVLRCWRDWLGSVPEPQSAKQADLREAGQQHEHQRRQGSDLFHLTHRSQSRSLASFVLRHTQQANLIWTPLRTKVTTLLNFKLFIK